MTSQDKPIRGEFIGEHGYKPGQIDDVTIDIVEGRITEEEGLRQVDALLEGKEVAEATAKKVGATKGRKAVSGAWITYDPDDEKALSIQSDEVDALRLTEGSLIRVVFVPWGANIGEVIRRHKGA